MGDMHLTREVVDRLIRGEFSRDERQVLREHLDGGPCEQCEEAVDDSPDDDAQFRALLGRAACLQMQALQRRAKAGDPDAERELHKFRFRALMRQVQRQ